MRYDKNNIELTDGSIINIHQTVNGENLFIVMTVDPLDIRYARDINLKYQYDKEELLDNHQMFDDEVDFEIVGNILNYIEDFRKGKMRQIKMERK